MARAIDANTYRPPGGTRGALPRLKWDLEALLDLVAHVRNRKYARQRQGR